MRGWVRRYNFCPFRVSYSYWINKNFLAKIGENSFLEKNINVKFKKTYLWSKFHSFVFLSFSGWEKDKEKIEEVLDEIDVFLGENCGEDYKEFLKEWVKGDLLILKGKIKN